MAIDAMTKDGFAQRYSGAMMQAGELLPNVSPQNLQQLLDLSLQSAPKRATVTKVGSGERSDAPDYAHGFDSFESATFGLRDAGINSQALLQDLIEAPVFQRVVQDHGLQVAVESMNRFPQEDYDNVNRLAGSLVPAGGLVKVGGVDLTDQDYRRYKVRKAYAEGVGAALPSNPVYAAADQYEDELLQEASGVRLGDPIAVQSQELRDYAKTLRNKDPESSSAARTAARVEALALRDEDARVLSAPRAKAAAKFVEDDSGTIDRRTIDLIGAAVEDGEIELKEGGLDLLKELSIYARETDSPGFGVKQDERVPNLESGVLKNPEVREYVARKMETTADDPDVALATAKLAAKVKLINAWTWGDIARAPLSAKASLPGPMLGLLFEGVTGIDLGRWQKMYREETVSLLPTLKVPISRLLTFEQFQNPKQNKPPEITVSKLLKAGVLDISKDGKLKLGAGSFVRDRPSKLMEAPDGTKYDVSKDYKGFIQSLLRPEEAAALAEEGMRASMSAARLDLVARITPEEASGYLKDARGSVPRESMGEARAADIMRALGVDRRDKNLIRQADFLTDDAAAASARQEAQEHALNLSKAMLEAQLLLRKADSEEFKTALGYYRNLMDAESRLREASAETGIVPDFDWLEKYWQKIEPEEASEEEPEETSEEEPEEE